MSVSVGNRIKSPDVFGQVQISDIRAFNYQYWKKYGEKDLVKILIGHSLGGLMALFLAT